MPTATKKTTRKATAPARASRRSKQVFDADNSEHWHKIASKGQMFMLAIAAFNGATFPGSEILGDRDAAKALIAELKESGKIK